MNKSIMSCNGYSFFRTIVVLIVIIIFIYIQQWPKSKCPMIPVVQPVRKSAIETNILTAAHFRILDVVLNGDPFGSQSITLFLSGHRNHITWKEFTCHFPASNTTSLGLIDHRYGEPFLTCSLPEVEFSAIKNGRNSFPFFLSIKDASIDRGTSFNSPPIQVRVYERSKHAISLYTMIRDKRNEVVEWIEYHRMLGIEHFYLYDNLGEDQIDVFLESYLDRNIVTIVKWPFKPLAGHHWNMIQCASMNHALKTFGPFNRWMGYFDVDEYFQLNSATEKRVLSGQVSLADLLDERFPEKSFSGGVQFHNCPISCFLSQTDVLSIRTWTIFQKCNAIVKPQDCRTRTKMFIRPRNVPMMRNIHALEAGIRFAAGITLADFGQFRHYHYGIVSSENHLTGTLDRSMDGFVPNLTERVSSFYAKRCDREKVH